MDDKEKREFEVHAKHPITELFVYISQDDEEGESVMVIQGQSGWFPLIGSDIERAASLRPIAETIADRYGKKIKLVKFTNRQDITHVHMRGLSKSRGKYV